MNTCCNKLLINECGMIRQVCVVWFDSAGGDASYHGLIRHPVESTPYVQLTDHPPPTFLLYNCPPWNFQLKVTKMPRHIYDNNSMKTWSPYLYPPYILPVHRTTICRIIIVYFYGLKSLFPTLFLLCAQQNVTTPVEIITNWWRFKTTLLHNKRANTLWDREGWRIIPPSEPTPLSAMWWIWIATLLTVLACYKTQRIWL